MARCPVCRTILDQSTDVFPVFFETDRRERQDSIGVNDVVGMLKRVQQLHEAHALERKTLQSELESARAELAAVRGHMARYTDDTERAKLAGGDLADYLADGGSMLPIRRWHKASPQGLTFAPGRLTLLSGDHVRSFDTERWKEVWTKEVKAPRSIAGDRHRDVAVGTDSGKVVIYDVVNDLQSTIDVYSPRPPAPVGDRPPSTASRAVGALTFIPLRHQLLAGTDAGAIVQVSTDTGRVLHVHQSPEGAGATVAIGARADGVYAGVTAGPSAVTMYDDRVAAAVGHYRQKGIITGAAFSQDLQTVHVISDGALQIIDLRTAQQSIQAGPPDVRAVAAHPYIPDLVAVGTGTGLTIMDRGVEAPHRETAPVVGLAWMEPGLAVATEEGVVLSES